MAFLLKDRTRDTTLTAGTGPFALSGMGPTSYRTFSASGYVAGDTFWGTIAHQTANEWMTGLLTYSATNQVTVTTVYESSNSNTAVTFSAGTKDVWCDLPASKVKSVGGLVYLNSDTVTNAPMLDIVLTSYTDYRALLIELINFIPATDDVELWLRLSTDGGSSYDAGATDYFYDCNYSDSAAGAGAPRSGGSSRIVIAGTTSATNAIGNGAAEGTSVILEILNQANTAVKPRVQFRGSYYTASNRVASNWGSGLRNAAQDTDAIRVLFETGNIASGTWALYGYA